MGELLSNGPDMISQTRHHDRGTVQPATRTILDFQAQGSHMLCQMMPVEAA
jgi:hypothetical protein